MNLQRLLLSDLFSFDHRAWLRSSSSSTQTSLDRTTSPTSLSSCDMTAACALSHDSLDVGSPPIPFQFISYSYIYLDPYSFP